MFVGAAVLVGVVTAILNLDTSVAFLTPVLVYLARSCGLGEAALLYGCLLLSNAGSLLLPGSNLTNLIVLGHLHLTGGAFLARMWLPSVAALAVTAVVVAVFERRSLRAGSAEAGEPARLVPGTGLVAVILAVVLVLALRSPAVPVFAVGVIAAGVHLARGRTSLRAMTEVLGVPLLTGLFGLAVALGVLGRAWSGPAELLAHLDSWGTAAMAGLADCRVQQPPGCVPAGGADARAPVRLDGGSEPGAEPVRDRIARLAALAARRAKSRRAAVTAPGQCSRRGSRAAVGRGRPRRAGADRCHLIPAVASSDVGAVEVSSACTQGQAGLSNARAAVTSAGGLPPGDLGSSPDQAGRPLVPVRSIVARPRRPVKVAVVLPAADGDAACHDAVPEPSRRNFGMVKRLGAKATYAGAATVSRSTRSAAFSSPG